MATFGAQLSRGQVARIVNQWIGVDRGYLGDFTYRTHADFYLEYCDLEDIDPSEYEGTTRERFAAILLSCTPRDQAKILRGILRKYPVDGDYAPGSRNQDFAAEMNDWIRLLENDAIGNQELRFQHATLVRALSDASILMQESDASSAIDRVHTAFHSYLKGVLNEEQIEFAPNDSITKLLKLLTTTHIAFAVHGTRNQDIQLILRSMSAVADALNPIRNHASIAHPNESLLGEAEAMLVVNTVRTILIYLDSKMSVGSDLTIQP